ncbi:unnamed protein product [Closterium sp. NIES-65]|nr:unnamed protein product [Closterium sp. NIES-65]
MTCSFSYSAIGQTVSPSLTSPLAPLLPLLLDADPTVRSQWATRDAAARLARETPLWSRARGGKGAGGASGGGEVAVEAAEGVGVAVGVVAGVEVAVAAVEAEAAAAVAVGAEAAVVAEVEALVVEEVELVGVVLRSGAAPVVRQLGGGFGPCTYVLRSGDRAGEQSGGAHPTQRCFGRLTDAWRQQFPEASEIPRWGELSRAGVAIYDLDFDAILAAMYAATISDEGDCYRCFPPDPGIATAALGAGEAAALGASASAPSGAGESALSDPSGGPVLSRFSTVLLCPTAPSGTLSGLYLPSFSTNLVSGADLQDTGVHQFTPASQRVTHCFDARTGRHLATFTRRPGSSLYSLTTGSPPVPASSQVAASGQVFAAASRSGLSLPPARVASCLTRLSCGTTVLVTPPCLVSEAWLPVPLSLVPPGPSSPPPGPGPSCVPCVEGRLRAAPHSSQFPPTEAPLQTLHMDVWGPARVRGQGHERYFLLVVDDNSRYTSVFPLRSKGDVTEVLIDWIRAARLQLRRSFGSDFPVLRLHSDRGGEFSSGLLRAYLPVREASARPLRFRTLHSKMGLLSAALACSAVDGEGRRCVLRSVSGISGVCPRLVCGQNVPRVALESSLASPLTPPGWQFYHPSSRRVLSSQDVTFDESVPYYRLFPYRTPSLPPPPALPCARSPPGRPPPPSGSCPFRCVLAWGVLRLELLSLGVLSLEPLSLGGAVHAAAGPARVASGGAGPGGSPGASSRREPLSPQELREWFAPRRWRRIAGAGASSAAEGAGAAGLGGASPGSAGAAGPASATGVGAAEGVGAEATAVSPSGGPAAGAAGGTRAGGAVGVGAATRGAGFVPAVSGVAARPRPYFVPLLQQVSWSSSSLRVSTACPVTVTVTAALPTACSFSLHWSYWRSCLSVVSLRLVLRRRFVLLALVVAVRCQRPPPVPGTHRMSLHPSTAPLRAPLPSPPESSLPALADPESDSLRAASPTVTRLLATVVTDPSFESTAASALVAKLVDFAARCRLDYAASLVAQQEEFQCLAAASPHLVSVLLTPEGDPDALDIPTPRSYAEAVEGPYSSQWQAAMDAEMASWKSTGTYVDAVPPPGANIVSGMWIFRVKRPPGSPPVFKARYVARGFSQRQGVDYFQTFSPTPKMTTLRVTATHSRSA